MKLTKDTIQSLEKLLDQLRNQDGHPVDELCGVLWNNGVRWDIAIEARETRKPEMFFDFFDHYRESDLEQCRAACYNVDVDFLASVLAYEGRKLEHWEMGYTSDVNNFFIAGTESLLSKSAV
ncbi:MAG: hypothetical protein LBN40_00165 [Oscillospiraceae bacterium]|jgi:hypothetical protein|nr:hypothetical protein [Oscillospiraceae bacterium]